MTGLKPNYATVPDNKSLPPTSKSGHEWAPIKMAAEKALPFEIRVPNAETVAAMRELDEGLGKRFDTVEDLMADLNADD
jgi:hypothetical protein